MRQIGCKRLHQTSTKGIYDLVGKMMHWEICKRLKSDRTTKWHMHKPESIQENEKKEIILDFEIHMDYQIMDRKIDLVIINKNKKKLPSSQLRRSDRQEP